MSITETVLIFVGIPALVVATVYALVAGMWMSVPFLLLFVQGYGYMAVLSYLPSVRDWSARGRAGGAATGAAGAGS